MFGPGLTVGPIDDLGDFSFVLFSGVFAITVNITFKRIQIYLLVVRLHRLLNPYLTNGFAHHYHLDESTIVFRGAGLDF